MTTQKKTKVSKYSKAALKELQKKLAAAIMNPLTANFKSKRVLRNGKSSNKLAEHLLKPSKTLSAFERLEIYNRQYWFRIIECLYDDFPGLRNILGDKLFSQLIQTYIVKYPSRSYTLRNIGSRLPKFLKNNPKYAAKRAAIAIQMLDLEWAQIEAYDSLAVPVFDPAKVNINSPEKLKLKLQPYIRLFELDYPLDDLVINLHKEHSQRSEAGSNLAPKKNIRPCKLPKKQKVYLVVHRFNNLVYYKRLEKPAFVLLSEIQKGASLAKACDKAYRFLTKSQRDAEVLQKLVHEWFYNWNQLGWFCAIHRK